MTDEQIDVPGTAGGASAPGGVGRARRLLQGWSANLVQMALGLSQQLLLIPAFLHVWTGDMLAAWLAIYAAGSLVVVADAGLQLRAINRFLAFKACADCDGRTATFYAALLRIYLGIVAVLGVLLCAAVFLAPPSAVLGFHDTPTFDAAMLVMILGMLLTVPANLVSGLYRVRGRYGRTVWLQNAALLLGQIAQLAALAWFGSLLAVAIAFVSMQLLFAILLAAFDAPRLFPFLRRAGKAPLASPSLRWTLGQFSRAVPFAVANITEPRADQRPRAARLGAGDQPRRGGAMGPDARDREPGARPVPPGDAAARRRASATTMRSATRSGCATSMPMARCS